VYFYIKGDDDCVILEEPDPLNAEERDDHLKNVRTN